MYVCILGQSETIKACVKAGRVTLLHETGFLHLKGIKIFGYETEIEKESEKKIKILGKKESSCSPCNFDRKDSSCPVYDRTVVIITWRRIEFSNLDSLKVFSVYLGGNNRWVPLSTID